MTSHWQGFLVLVLDRSVEILQHLSPDTAVGTGVLGLCLLGVEVNRPGLIVPGTIGVLILLFSVAALLEHPMQPWAATLLLLAGLALLVNTRARLPNWVLILATCSLVAGLRFLIPLTNVSHVSLLTAALSGLFVGPVATFLSRLAFHAREAKRVH